MREVEDGNSDEKDRTTTVELQSHEKSRGGAPSPLYPPQAPLPTVPLLSSALLLAQHAQKGTPRLKGGRKGVSTKLICCMFI